MMRVSKLFARMLSLGLGAVLAGHGMCQAQETTLVSSAAPARTAETRSTEPRRSVEADLQQAWLSDPITFPYYLEAQMVGSKLELRGHVPNRRVHDQALKHAFEHATTNILDAIRETPGVEVRTVVVPPEQLQALATQTLQRYFGHELSHVRIEAKTGGAILLLGTVGTADQKRAAVQSLRHVPGCTCIANHLEITSGASTAAATPASKANTATASATREENSNAEVIIISPMKGTPAKATSTRPEAAPPRAWVPPQIPAAPLPKPESTSHESSNVGSGVVPASYTEASPAQTSHLVPVLKRRFPGVQRINVQHQDKNRVRIDLWVNTAAEGHRLVSELDRIDELAPYYCETHIHHN